MFASSGGAVAALALAARYPARVHTVVAHEPPVTELLPDAPHVRAVIDDIEDAYRASGSGAAWGKFVSLVMHDGPVTVEGVPPATWPPQGSAEPDAAEEASAPSEKQLADDELFFLRMLKPFTRYEPAVEVLRSGDPQVVIAVGEASGGEVARRSALALAERLGTPATTFPHDHGGFMADPQALARAIRQTLTER